MPKDKTQTRLKILPAAKVEFPKKGFEQASMRPIAARIGMSVAGLYRYFEDREAPFSALVEPAFRAMQAWYQIHKAADYECLERNDLDRMWKSDADVDLMIEALSKFRYVFAPDLPLGENTLCEFHP